LERARKQGNAFVFLMLSTTYTMNLIQDKHLKQSEKCITDTLNNLLRSAGSLPEPAGLLYTNLSIILFEQGKWEEALKALDSSRRVDPNPTSSNHRIVRNLHASCIYRMQGKMDKAQESLQSARRHFEYRRPSLIATEYMLGREGEFYLQQGNLEAVERILEHDNLHDDSIALNTLRAKFLLREGNYTELLRLIEVSLTSKSNEIFTTPFELELLQPLALYHLDQVFDAKKLLAKHLREFAREGIICPFLALGSDLLVLLRIVYWTESLSRQSKAFIETIFEAFDEAVFLFKWSESGEAKRITINITPREKEIVSEMARGLSNLEIAWQLNITESTVKTHINNIYRKFGVSNRVQAVQFARDNNLL
jgi:LuxR family maltose regulon positive regulatory protein